MKSRDQTLIANWLALQPPAGCSGCSADLPAHVLWGRRDPVAVAAIAERLAGEIPGSRLTWLDDLGHYPMVEDPESYAAEVLDFLPA